MPDLSLRGSSKDLILSGDGLLEIAGIEATLPSIAFGISMTLLDTEVTLSESPQLVRAVAGDKTYDGA